MTAEERPDGAGPPPITDPRPALERLRGFPGQPVGTDRPVDPNARLAGSTSGWAPAGPWRAPHASDQR